MTEEEKRRAYHKAYRESHKEEIKAYKKAYNEAHREDKLERYCSHIENIENYELAKADDFIGWDIHHRLETHNSDGERRTVDLSSKELKALGTYYDRPASELIFLKHGDHIRLHSQQRTPCSSETRAKLRAANLGKHFSDETRAKLSTSHRGKHYSEETRAKMREAWKHRAPMSEATKAKMREAWKHRAPMSEATKAKMSTSRRGKHRSEETRAKMREAWKHRRAKTSANN